MKEEESCHFHGQAWLSETSRLINLNHYNNEEYLYIYIFCVYMYRIYVFMPLLDPVVL